jgi:hypothetical protein
VIKNTSPSIGPTGRQTLCLVKQNEKNKSKIGRHRINCD